MDEVTSIMATSCIGTWLMGYDQTSKPKDSLRIFFKVRVLCPFFFFFFPPSAWSFPCGWTIYFFSCTCPLLTVIFSRQLVLNISF